MYEHIKNQNDRLRAQLDDIFVERKSQEDQIHGIESQLARDEPDGRDEAERTWPGAEERVREPAEREQGAHAGH